MSNWYKKKVYFHCTTIFINLQKIAKPKGLLGGPLVKKLILNKKDVSSLGRHFERFEQERQFTHVGLKLFGWSEL